MTKYSWLRVPVLVFLIVWAFAFCGVLRSSAEETCQCQPTYDWHSKIIEAKKALKPVRLKHHRHIKVYTDIRRPKFVVNGELVEATYDQLVSKKYQDFIWKEVGLVLMNVEDGRIKVIKIRKEGHKLQNNNKDFVIEIEERISGLTWNGKNTAFRIVKPEGWVAIANKWIELVNGKTKESIYIPYSTSLHLEKLIQLGNLHLAKNVTAALDQLEKSKVKSLTFPGRLLTETIPHGPPYPVNLVLIEHTDPGEFYAFRAGLLELNPFDRVKILLALNGEGAFSSKNFAGAVGLTQFTNNRSKKRKSMGTWDIIRKAYPAAKLSKFQKGAIDHIQSIKAAILLYDFNLAALIKAFGAGILADPELGHYLYAAHNCGISRVVNALKQPGDDWRMALRELSRTDETNVFLEKLDYLERGL